MPQSGRDPVVSKNHNVSHYDISRLRDPAFLIFCCGVGLLSLDLKFKEQEGSGPTISSLYKRERDILIENIKLVMPRSGTL